MRGRRRRRPLAIAGDHAFDPLREARRAAQHRHRAHRHADQRGAGNAGRVEQAHHVIGQRVEGPRLARIDRGGAVAALVVAQDAVVGRQVRGLFVPEAEIGGVRVAQDQPWRANPAVDAAVDRGGAGNVEQELDAARETGRGAHDGIRMVRTRRLRRGGTGNTG
jgi:hypothetical protein